VAKDCKFEPLPIARVARRRPLPAQRTPRHFKPRVPWRELLQLWNKRYPLGHEYHYKDVRNFYKDFKEAKEVLFDYD
jgi:hypothetical protein